MFDGTITPAQRRAMLIYELRNLEDWPWDYGNCTTCAIGLIDKRLDVRLLRDSGLTSPNIEFVLGEALGIDPRKADHIFINFGVRSGIDMNKVTPEMIADALESCG